MLGDLINYIVLIVEIEKIILMKETFKKRLKRIIKNWIRKKEEADYTDTYWKREFYNIDSTKEEIEWKIVKLDGGGFIRRPFPIKNINYEKTKT